MTIKKTLFLFVFCLSLISVSSHATILFEHGFEGETLNSEAWLMSESPDWWQAASQTWSPYIYRYASNDYARDGSQSVKVHTQYTAGPPVSGYRAEFTRRGSIGGAVEQFDWGQEYWIGWSVYLPSLFDTGEGYEGEAIHGQIHGIPDSYYATGTHTGGTSTTVLTDSTRAWVVNGLVGARLHNTKDVSYGTITSNTATTATVTALAGGTDNRWEVGDSYRVQELDTNPPIGITLEKRSGVLGWYCVIRGDDEPITATAGKDRYIEYSLGNATKGAWTDFVINMKLDYHSVGNTGFFRLWMNDVLVIDEAGEQNCYNDVNGPFICWGSYHYPWGSYVPTVTDEIIYIDSIKVGDATSSYIEVEPGAGVVAEGTVFTQTSGNVTEAGIVTGGTTIILNLDGTTWNAFDNTIRAAIVAGMDSDKSEATGWDALIKADPGLWSATGVVRTSDTVCTITLPASAAYDITANETITINVPASAVASAEVIQAGPDVLVSAYIPAASGTGFVGSYHASGAMGMYNSNGYVATSQ